MPKPTKNTKEVSQKTQVKLEYDIGDIKVEHDMIIKKEEPDGFTLTQHTASSKPIRKVRRKKKAKAKPLAGVKNVVKNYGKAMCTFAYSEIALSYLAPFIKEENVTLKGFTEWIQTNKESVDSIESLRWLLLPSDQEEEAIASYKRIFQRISETFLKYYAVNWIYSGKVAHRKTHMHFRHKMLRRIRNPEQFTYLQNANERKAPICKHEQ